MKKSKCALGLMTLLTVSLGLAACDQPTKDKNGNIFTYTDNAGNVIGYTASDLYDSYQTSTSTLSSEFEKVYEVLVRHYYDKIDEANGNGTDKPILTALQKAARTEVEKDQNTATTNASTNKTSFQVEFEKILTSHNVKNVDELYQYHLYEKEKDKFETTFYSEEISAMKNGNVNADGTEIADKDSPLTSGSQFMPGDATDTTKYPYGIGNEGWIKEQMPYVIRHILVQVSAASGDFTEGTLTEDTSTGTGTTHQATKLGSIVARIAGATINSDGTAKSLGDGRESFGTIAADSDDSSSTTTYGETSLMTKIMSSDLVPEFKLGIYAFESMFRKFETTNTYANANVYRIAPGLKETAKALTDVDEEQTVEAYDNVGQKLTVADSSIYGETDDAGNNGIGQIPFGAAVALYNSASVTGSAWMGTGHEAFYPRNIIFNKYFNKHNVCVITPNNIAYNTNDVSTFNDTYAGLGGKETFNGTYDANFAALPGFSTDTSSTIQVDGHNVLTNSEGQVVLAVRAGTSSYQGVHFMVVQRSALSQYGIKTAPGTDYVSYEDAHKDGVASLSEYYTTKYPGLADYPTYEDSTGTVRDLTTYVNYNRDQKTDYITRSGAIVSGVKTYNGALSTYLFEKLITGNYNSTIGSLKFANADFQATMENYCRQKRQSTLDDSFSTWKSNWKTYAETLLAQKEQRSLRDANGNGPLISEVCAMSFNTHSSTDWTSEKGACYYVKG